MTIRLYCDEDSMRHALVAALRRQGVDVLTALEAGTTERTDEGQLSFAAMHDRVIYSFNALFCLSVLIRVIRAIRGCSSPVPRSMKLEAIYNDGQIEFTTPVRLRHSRVRLIVEVPDSEVVLVLAEDEGGLDEYALEMKVRLDAIRNAPLPSDANLPPLTAEQIERLEAIQMGEDR